MVFSTYVFLVWFLPITLGLYYLVPPRHRNALIAAASYVFYGWWRPEYCALLLAMTVFNYVCGARIARGDSQRTKKAWVTASVVGSLGLLGFFKYAGMLSVWADTLARLFVSPAAGSEHVLPILDVVLPIGISFFTFQALSYTIDLYRGHAREAENLVSFAAYIAMFPQLIAGPIVRYEWIADELRERVHSFDKCFLGVRFFLIGLAKKALVADTFALGVPVAFGVDDPGFAASWLGTLCYTLQIYFDFSAYSDMAVGLGLFLGFSFPQNFDSPYKSASITEFWRRWHITLSTWLRDYLYIPLGGNRKGPRRTYVNLALVMLLGGLWHGASIVFVIWGAWHGVLLAFERYLGKRSPIERWPKAVRVGMTQLLVIIGWVPFRAESLESAGDVLQGMFLTMPSFAGDFDGIAPGLWPLVAVGFVVCWFAPNSWEMLRSRTWFGITREAVLGSLALVAVLAYRASPFLYFQF